MAHSPVTVDMLVEEDRAVVAPARMSEWAVDEYFLQFGLVDLDEHR